MLSEPLDQPAEHRRPEAVSGQDAAGVRLDDDVARRQLDPGGGGRARERREGQRRQQVARATHARSTQGESAGTSSRGEGRPRRLSPKRSRARVDGPPLERCHRKLLARRTRGRRGGARRRLPRAQVVQLGVARGDVVVPAGDTAARQCDRALRDRAARGRAGSAGTGPNRAARTRPPTSTDRRSREHPCAAHDGGARPRRERRRRLRRAWPGRARRCPASAQSSDDERGSGASCDL